MRTLKEVGGEGEGGSLGSSSGGVDSVGRSDDNAVEGVGGHLNLVDCVAVMGLEADLSAIGPSTLDPGIIGE